MAMDYFSKWPEVYTLPNQVAVTVVNVVVSQLFHSFGLPAGLLPASPASGDVLLAREL